MPVGFDIAWRSGDSAKSLRNDVVVRLVLVHGVCDLMDGLAHLAHALRDLEDGLRGAEIGPGEGQAGRRGLS